MLTGKELGAALTEAVRLKNVSWAKLARDFGIKGPSVYDWRDYGRIGKKHIDGLVAYFSDVVPASHWGISAAIASPERMREGGSDWTMVRASTQGLGLGRGVEADEYAETHKLMFRTASMKRKHLSPDACAVAYGKGDSMLPRIHDGDAILFNTQQIEPRDGKLFVIEIEGRGANREPQVKRCNIIDDVVYFEALNPDGDHAWKKPKKFGDRKNPIRILGRVRWIGSWED